METKKGYISNPLSVIGFFLVLVEGIAGLVIVKSNLPVHLNTVLVLFIVIFPFVVLGVFFSLVTKYHEKLYAPKDYCDEGNFVKTFYNKENKSEIIIDTKDTDTKQKLVQLINDEESENDVSIINLEDAKGLVSQLINLGYKAGVYKSNTTENFATKEKHAAIWLGTQVPLKNAKEIMKSAFQYYPHLKFVHLSTDGSSRPPERIHRQIFIGGATSTAQRYGLQVWSKDDFDKIQDIDNLNDFHSSIRAKY
ncbi:MAG: hypothetical protein JJT76_10305 [Clostridiaceae bacterium]|nr:hypothetical protein [Clostridiaceae bacterium]